MTIVPAVAGQLFEPGKKNADGSYVHLYRRLRVRTELPLPRAVLCGPRWRRFLMTYRTTTGRLAYHPCIYDFAPDVRELVCEPVQFDRVAMWADPRERL